ncbi:MAG: helicase [Alphaproteobacteria bacterium]|nr:helicase [Alphaproteobacteria bacterium]
MSDDIATQQVEIREHLIEALEADLVGPMGEHEVLETSPSRWYLTGFLVPAGAPEEQRTDDTGDEALGNEVEAEADEAADDVRVARPFLPASMGLSFLVPSDATVLEVDVSWGEYEELDEETTLSYRDAERARWTERAIPHRDDDDETKSVRFRYWRRVLTFEGTVPVHLGRHDAHPDPIPGTGGVFLRVVDQPVEADGVPSGTRAVSLFLLNGRDPVEGSAADERFLFQARLTVRSSQGFVPRRRMAVTDHPDDRRNDVQFRDHLEWAVGHGVASTAEAHEGTCSQVGTAWVPRAAVHRMKAKSIDGVLLEMDKLAALTEVDTLRRGVAPLVAAYRAWIDTQRSKLPGLSASRQETAQGLLDEAMRALGRIEEGVEVLDRDPLALEAFQIANAAMDTAARKARPDDKKPKWRLFQFAFVMLNIAGATDPHHADRDRVDLLFFPTGGGKTEAYLGVAAYVIALRRLRGRDRPDGGAGVAVLLRYTLRLLTLDQLRRASQLICAMELQRRDQPDRLGHHRFSIGLWVGRKATANRLEDAAEAVRKLKRTGRSYGGPPPVPLAACPWCDTKLDGESFELVPDGKHAKALTVGCSNVDCDFSFGADPSAPQHRDGLPLVVVDEHIYRELPTIVVGTVDKFASLPWRGSVGMLFGRARAEGEYGFLGEHEKVPQEARPLPDGLLPPELIIQDELHLISGPLGTMVGLYETAIDALCRDHTGYGPKVLASTATARRATEQIRAVFGRPNVHLFPPQGLDDGDTFFAETDKSAAKTRVYLGVAAPGRSMKVLAARTYTALLAAAQKHWHEAGAPGRDNPGDTYMTLVAYFNALKELGGAQRLVLEDVAQRTDRMARRRPLDEERSSHFDDRRLGFDVLELTSRQSTDDIAQAIDRLNSPFGRGRDAKHDVLLASSMISVGVDISRLGLMVVNGQPRTTAEYIQASSRVGRETPGLVVTAYNVFKPRDRSHYERFTAYHESFYREVEASSVTPFSTRAVDRGLAGVVVGLVRHLGPRMAPSEAVRRMKQDELAPMEARVIELLTKRALDHREDVSPTVESNLRSRIEFLIKQWKLLIDHVDEAGGTLKYSPWETPKNFQALLSTAVDDLVGDNSDLLDDFRAPTSMRDVEPGVHVWVDIKKREATA